MITDISSWAPGRQVEHLSRLGYFDLMGFLSKERMHPGRAHSTRRLLDGCGLTPSSWVLEAGCGTGASTVFAASAYGCRAVGVDQNMAMIEKAARRAADDAATVGRVAFTFARAVCLPFPDGAFDLVFSEAAVGFMDQKARVLEEFRRVVKPGGFLGIVDFHYTRRPDESLLREMNRAVAGHLEPLDGDDWLGLFEGAGWELAEAQEMPYGAVTASLLRKDAHDTLLARPELNRLSDEAKEHIRERLWSYESLFNRNRESLAYRICRLRNPG